MVKGGVQKVTLYLSTEDKKLLQGEAKKNRLPLASFLRFTVMKDLQSSNKIDGQCEVVKKMSVSE